MLYGDEEIIRQRVAVQKKAEHNIHNEITINNISYAFTRREFELGFSMVIPDKFKMLAPEYIERKYPYKNRPQIIMSNDDTTVTFAFDYAFLLQKKDLEIRLLEYRSIVKKLHQSNVFLAYDYLSTIDEEDCIAFFSYRSHALDGDLFNFSFFTDLPDKELFGWFTCPIELQTKWEPLVMQMIQTIKPLSLAN